MTSKLKFAPAASDGTEHGKPVSHGAVAETKLRPVGVGSVMSSAVASEGPRFSTARAKTRSAPLATKPGPVLVMTRSATGITSVGSVSSSLLGSGSGSLPVTVAVFDSVPTVSGSTVTSMATDWVAPAARSPMVQGKPPAHGAEMAVDGDPWPG